MYARCIPLDVRYLLYVLHCIPKAETRSLLSKYTALWVTG